MGSDHEQPDLRGRTLAAGSATPTLSADSATSRSDVLHELFAGHARRTPYATAVVCEGRAWTYSQLDADANRLAAHLKAQGVLPGGFVGILLDRSYEFVVAVLGILKAGCAYAPLPSEYPASKLAFMIADTGMPLAITNQDLADQLPGDSIPLVFMEADEPWWQQTAASGSPASVEPSSRAYVMYTSGSTGKPKGVVVPHRAITRLVVGQSYAAFGPDLRTLLLAPTAFDASTFELWAPLLNGGTCVVFPDRLIDRFRLGQVLANGNVNCLWLTAGLFNLLIDEAPDVLSAVAHVLTGGEALSVQHVRRALARLPGLKLTNGYGPTESTTFACTHEIDPDEAFPNRSVPIGRPLAKTTCFIVDDNMQPAPPGVAGELLIGGQGLALEYLNQPGLTAEKFIANPCGSNPHDRVYRTGDRCRWLPNGLIEFLGRDDGQVKIRGHRIEVGEIEAAIATIAGIQQNVVVAKKIAPGDVRLVAYIVEEAGGASDASLRHTLAEMLPDFMIPNAFVRLGELPLTPNGKIDRDALPLPERAAATGPTFQPPRTPLENRLAELWQELLQLPAVGIDDNFFQCGGNSLLAMRLVSRARDQLQLVADIRSVFESPTIAALSARWQPSGPAGEASSNLPEAARPIHDDAATPAASRIVSASPAQKQLWFHQQYAPQSTAYTIADVHRIRGPLDVGILQASLDAIVARHESLRTTFRLRDNEPQQVVARSGTWPLRTTSATGSTVESRDADTQRLLSAEFSIPFDLEHGPLVRGLVVHLSHDEHVLMVLMHHIISDHWSLGVLHRELARCYKALKSGKKPALDPLRIADADFFAHRQASVPAGELSRQESHWLQKLAGAPPSIELPLDRGRPSTASFKGATAVALLDPAAAQLLAACADRLGCTRFVVVLAAFFQVLKRWSGAEDLVLGVPVAERTLAEAADTIGFLVNSLPLRVDLSGDPSFRDLLERVRNAVVDEISNSDVPFTRLLQLLGSRRDAATNPLFNVMCLWQDDTAHPLRLEGLTVEPVVFDGGFSRLDLTLYAVQTEKGLEFRLEYANDLFDPATANRLLDRLVSLLNRGCSDLETPLSRLPDGDYDRVVHAFNATAVDFGALPTLHEMVARQGRETPDAIALISGDARITFADLGRRVNLVAETLRQLGARPGAIVGIGVERSIDMVVGMLATLEAGAAFLPLDPAAAADRLNFMLADAEAQIVLTHERFAAVWPATVKTLLLDRIDQDTAAEPSSEPAKTVPRATGDSTAYVLYTSGSTGRPKGVGIHHSAVVNFLLAMQERFPMLETDVVLQSTPAIFDISLYEIFAPLTIGATLMLAPAGRLDPRQLALFMKEQGITIAQFVPSMLGMLVADAAFNGHGPLRRVFCGGEAMTRDLMRRFYERSSADLVNVYGPTEATIWATSWTCEPGFKDHAPPIGRPLANTRCYVLDKQLHPAPIGAVGELFIGGPQVAVGYLKRPELTRERFIVDPFDEIGRAHV